MKVVSVVGILFLFSFNTMFGQQNLNHSDLKIEQPEGPKPWTNRNINDKPGQFQFAIVTDRTGGHRPGVFEDGVKKLNLLQPEFVMSVGDLIEGYTTDTMEINRQWDEFSGFVDQLEMPFFFVPGNHDITNPVMEKVWEKRFGLKNYSFVYKDVLFMAVNSEDLTRGAGRGSISSEQFDWIKKTLIDHPKVKWTFMFMHQPLWAQQTDPIKWFDVEKLLEDRNHTVFVGHRHHYVAYERNKSTYFMLATMGGGSPLRGPQFGEFDHFVWVTMTEKGPVLANLQLEGIFDKNLHTEEIEAFTSKLWAADIVRIEPLFINNHVFKRDSMKLRLTNPYDLPMKVKLSHSFSWDIKADIREPEVLLEPNSVKFIAIEMEARKEKPLEKLKGVKLKAEVAVENSPGKGDFFVPFEFTALPVKKYDLVKTSDRIKIDGNLSDWKSLPYELSSSEGARFGMLYDKSYVYIGVQVNDSEVISSTSQTTFQQDFVGFVFDAQPLAKSAADKGDEWFKNSLYFITSPEDRTGKNTVWDLGDEEKALEWKCIPNEKGFAFEVAIPISYIQKFQGSNWQTARINIVVQDRDTNSNENSRTTWQPNWRDGSNIPGSGMFFK